MKTKKRTFSLCLLFGLFLFLAFSALILEQTKKQVPKESYACMLDAAKRTEAAFSAIREERLKRGYMISPIDDPCGTGLIGDSYTEITTTLGSLESKRSTTNPNVSAMIVDLLSQCNVHPGDRVAVNLSSSFPAMNIAVLCALDAVGADGVIINSVGASTYGANLPDFTYLDMEQALLDRQLITNHTQYFSLGGADDIGREMPEETKDAIISRLRSRGLTFLYYEDLEQNIVSRYSIYGSGDQPVCFINVGGNLLSFGGGTEMIGAHNGLLLPGKVKFSSDSHGLIPLYLKENIPVIHLLNMKTLLPANGLPFDPQPVPAPGSGDVYTEWRYNRPLAAVFFFCGLGLIFLIARYIPKRHMPI